MTTISNTAPPDLSCVVGSFLQSGVLPPVIADEARAPLPAPKRVAHSAMTAAAAGL